MPPLPKTLKKGPTGPLDFNLSVDAVTIRGSIIEPDLTPPYPTVIIAHGIPAVIKDVNDQGYAEFGAVMAQTGLGAVVFNFRGCGLSGGNFDIEGWQADLRAVIAYARAQSNVDNSRLGLLGFSGGAAVAVCVGAADTGIRALAACACPADLDMIGETSDLAGMLDYFRKVKIIRDAGFPPGADAWRRAFTRVRPEVRVAHLAPRPLLIVHGDADETVPPEDAYRLYAAAEEPKTLEIVPGAGHRLRHHGPAMRRVMAWFGEAMR